jgi:hypothetical protein
MQSGFSEACFDLAQSAFTRWQPDSAATRSMEVAEAVWHAVSRLGPGENKKL